MCPTPSLPPIPRRRRDSAASACAPFIRPGTWPRPSTGNPLKRFGPLGQRRSEGWKRRSGPKPSPTSRTCASCCFLAWPASPRRRGAIRRPQPGPTTAPASPGTATCGRKTTSRTSAPQWWTGSRATVRAAGSTHSASEPTTSRSTSPREPVDRLEIGGRELEVEDIRVLHDPLPASRLRDHHELVLQVPPDDHLSGRLAVPPRDLDDDRMIEAPGYEGAIALEDDPSLPGRLDDLPVVEERTPPDLIDGRRHSGLLGELIDLADRVVAHPNGARKTLSLRLDERPPCGHPCTATRRPMDEPEVDIVGS